MNSVIVIMTVFAWGVGVLSGLWIGTNDDAKLLREEAINRGFAQYNSKNGKWEWKE